MMFGTIARRSTSSPVRRINPILPGGSRLDRGVQARNRIANFKIGALIDVKVDAGREHCLAGSATFSTVILHLDDLASECYGTARPVMTVCVAPLVAVAVIGEFAKVRTFAWYSGATGTVAASAPWLIRVALRLPRAADYSSVELRFASIFFFTGLIFRSVYWFLAGRNADGRRAI